MSSIKYIKVYKFDCCRVFTYRPYMKIKGLTYNQYWVRFGIHHLVYIIESQGSPASHILSMLIGCMMKTEAGAIFSISQNENGEQ
jgi:hypothetical protein